MNFKNLTYKRKNQILIGGAIVFLLFIYNFVISITVGMYRSNQVLETKVKEGLTAPEKKRELEANLEKFNNSLNKYFSDSLKNREYLLGVVSDYCNKHHLILREFPESRVTQEKDFEIETNVVVAEGGFLNLLKMVYELEQKIKVARPASVNFEKKFDHKRKKEVLTATVYLQNLRMKKDGKDI